MNYQLLECERKFGIDARSGLRHKPDTIDSRPVKGFPNWHGTGQVDDGAVHHVSTYVPRTSRPILPGPIVLNIALVKVNVLEELNDAGPAPRLKATEPELGAKVNAVVAGGSGMVIAAKLFQPRPP